MSHHLTTLRVGTQNQGKLREFRQILSPLGFAVIGLDDIPGFDVVEDGSTFAENALKKARALVLLTGETAIADDSGLVVDALGGLPGIFSARYAGVTGPEKDAANRHKLLQALGELAPAQRTARFVCAVALVEPRGLEQVFEGKLEGTIGLAERGTGGFGYDSLFEVPQRNLTVAELPASDKNAISHRSRAIAQLVDFLRTRDQGRSTL